MPQAAMAVGALISAGVGVYGASQQEKARQKADQEMGRQADARRKAEIEAAAKLRDEEARTSAEATRDSQAAAARASARTGRRGTILTSPLGTPSQGGKTLLGS